MEGPVAPPPWLVIVNEEGGLRGPAGGPNVSARSGSGLIGSACWTVEGCFELAGVALGGTAANTR